MIVAAALRALHPVDDALAAGIGCAGAADGYAGVGGELAEEFRGGGIGDELVGQAGVEGVLQVGWLVGHAVVEMRKLGGGGAEV